MIGHAEIETFLASEFPPQGTTAGLRLVARYEDAALGLPAGRARIFLPDLHLLSKDAATRFPKTGFRRGPELVRFLKALARFKDQNAGDLQVFQMGDLFDIWRIKGKNSKRKVDDTSADHAQLLELLLFGPPSGSRASIVAGNHDYDLHTLSEWNAARFWFLNDSPAGVPDALVVHGDCFDWVENFFPQAIKSMGVQLAKMASAGQHELDHLDLVGVLQVNDLLPKGDKVVGTAQADLRCDEHPIDQHFNVVPWTKEVGKVGRYFEAARSMAMALKDRGRDLRVVVCGHSHDARIVFGDRGDGVMLVLMDCGAWLGECRFEKTSAWRPSAQIGVMVGNDLRIYQLI